MSSKPEQLGFAALLDNAERDNRVRLFERQTAHLPGTMETALPFYRQLLDQHHAAMLAADVEETMHLREEAHDLARKLNGGEGGILAHEDAPGCLLARETAAPGGAEPIWGQQGNFVVEVEGIRVRIAMDGIFGTGGHYCYWPGFAAHAVEFDRPFISETGYRSFLGNYVDPMPGWTPAELVRAVIVGHIEDALRGNPVQLRL